MKFKDFVTTMNEKKQTVTCNVVGKGRGGQQKSHGIMHDTTL